MFSFGVFRLSCLEGHVCTRSWHNVKVSPQFSFTLDLFHRFTFELVPISKSYFWFYTFHFLSFWSVPPLTLSVSLILKAISPPSTHQTPTPSSYLELSLKCHCFLYLSPFTSTLPREQDLAPPPTFFLLPPELLNQFIFYSHTFLSTAVMTLSGNLIVYSPPPIVLSSCFSGNGEKCWRPFSVADIILWEKIHFWQKLKQQ